MEEIGEDALFYNLTFREGIGVRVVNKIILKLNFIPLFEKEYYLLVTCFINCKGSQSLNADCDIRENHMKRMNLGSP
jgi:hypothetical protein